MRLGLFALVASSCTAFAEDPWGPRPIGESREDVVELGLAPGQLSFVDGEVRCAAGPFGYWYTPRSYRNYRLRAEWRFVRPPGLANDEDFGGNAGWFLHITGEHKVWPHTVEVQGMNATVGFVFAVGGAPEMTEVMDDPAARKRVRRPVGEWNEIEIESSEGLIRSWLNGTLVSSGRTTLREGPIGFECEGAEIHWRNILLTELVTLR